MRHILKAYFSKPATNGLFWVGWALIFRGIFFCWLLLRSFPFGFTGFKGTMTGDTKTYLTPITHLINYGTYTPDFRMPGYGAFYLLPASIFPKAIAANILIGFQWLTASLALYYFARLAQLVFQSSRAFYIAFFLFAACTFANAYDATLMTESLSVSAVIFTLYAFALLLQQGKPKYALYAGIAFGWLIFMKPVYLPILAMLWLILLPQVRRKALPAMVLLLLPLPFVLADAAWIARNYSVHHRLVPLNQAMLYPHSENSYEKNEWLFMEAWGASIAVWEQDAEVRWFTHVPYGKDTIAPPTCPFPQYIYTTAFNADSLLAVRNDTDTADDTRLPNAQRIAADGRARQRFATYTASIKKEHPLLYYIGAPARLLQRMLIHHGSPEPLVRPTSPMSWGIMTVRTVMGILYIASLVLAAIGLWLQRRQWRQPVLLAALSILAYTVIIYPLVFRYAEMRYCYPAYPVIMLYACAALSRLFKQDAPAPPPNNAPLNVLIP